MSSDVVIRLEGVGKAYPHFSRPEDRFKQMLFGRFQTYYENFWALKPMDLEINAGETWGFIGRNGSGKSTMLQMICGNLAPTTGRITVKGKVAALLELGAGFNPEFTGRENVYINGALAGYNESEIDARLDQILAFADIGAFVDQPVKTYSSGMFARLAFAVAIHVDPDILVVDEALAVGDEAFQRKCFARMEEIKDSGASILFVSHAGSFINQFCDSAALLHRGQCVFQGRPKTAVFYYQKIGNATEDEEGEVLAEIANLDGESIEPDITQEPFDLDDDKEDQPEMPPSAISNSLDNDSNTPKILEYFDAGLIPTPNNYPERGARITQFRMLNYADEYVNVVVAGRRYKFEVEVEFSEICKDVRFFILVRTTSGIDLAGSAHPCLDADGIDFEANTSIKFTIDFICNLTPGAYFMNFAVSGPGEYLYHRIVDLFGLRVVLGEDNHATGLVDLYEKSSVLYLKNG